MYTILSYCEFAIAGRLVDDCKLIEYIKEIVASDYVVLLCAEEHARCALCILQLFRQVRGADVAPTRQSFETIAFGTVERTGKEKPISKGW